MRKTARIFSLAFSIIFALAAMAAAVPALEIERRVTQPDGSTFMATQRGDEHFHWTEASDGCVVMRREDGWWVYSSRKGKRYEPMDVHYKAGARPPKGAAVRDVCRRQQCECGNSCNN